MISTIGFDGDDTLWDNENLFADAQEKFRRMLSHYHEAAWIDRKLLETERRNLDIFGYGSKGFALSMIETAIELTEGRISGKEIQAVIDSVKEILSGPTNLLAGVAPVLQSLSLRYQLILITKGDLFEQEAKIAKARIAGSFAHIEIVSEKDANTYRRILAKHRVRPEEFLMVGNSMRSDILPVLEAGGAAVYIPYHITWAHELAGDMDAGSRFARLERIDDLPAYVGGARQEAPA